MVGRPSGTVETIQQGRSFQVSPSLLSPCPAVRACGIFSNRILLSSSGIQSTAGARAFYGLWSLWGLIGRELILGTGFSFTNLMGSDSVLFPSFN